MNIDMGSSHGLMCEKITRKLIDMNRLVGPSEVEKRTGLGVDILRDWRRRKILTAGTQQENGRWAYSVGDVAQLAIVNLLTKWRIVSDLSDAFQVAQQAVPFIYAVISTDTWFKQRVGKLPLIVFFAVREGERLQFEVVHKLDDITRLRVPGFVVIDTHELAVHLSEQLEGLFDQQGGN